MGDLKIYDGSEVSLVFAAIPIVSGYAEDEFCTIEFMEEAFKLVVGADGEVTRSKTNNRTAKIQFKLMQTSSANIALSALLNADIYTAGGASVAPVLVKDRQGTSLYSGAKAWLVKHPDASFSKTAKERVWEIQVADLAAITGGN
jgi:hypothetical protein